MSLAPNIAGGAALQIVVASLLLTVGIYACLWAPASPRVFFGLRSLPNSKIINPRDDELELTLRRTSMEDKTLIISVLNIADVKENGMLDFFLRSLREGEDTEHLVKNILLITVDEITFQKCNLRRLRCYQLVSEQAVFTSANSVKITRNITFFLGDVLRRGYSFIFTDIDVMWLRNPFTKLSHAGEDMQISCDSFNGHPLDDSNSINTGFYFVASNQKTITLFDEWYGRRKNTTDLTENDVLSEMRYEGIFQRLDMKVTYLDTLYFSGFCEDSRDFQEVRTVHANCCPMVKAKLTDLTAALEVWKRSRSTSNATWPAHKACLEARKMDISKYKLQNILQRASMPNRTLIISMLNKAYAKENGMLDLFLKSLHQGVDTGFLIKHLLIVAVDKIAFKRCKLLKLHCYRLVTKGVDLSKEQLYMTHKFIKMMWQRTVFLGDALKLGYNFIFTDMDVIWLRNPFTKLNRNGEDMQISCDQFNGQPFNESNPINTGFYFVVSNNKTIALFDTWYASRSIFKGMKEQDVLGRMISNGIFRKLSMKVKFLDTRYFSGFCQDNMNFREVSTVHANCCRSVKAKLADLSASLEVWKSYNGTEVNWPEHKACNQSWKEK